MATPLLLLFGCAAHGPGFTVDPPASSVAVDTAVDPVDTDTGETGDSGDSGETADTDTGLGVGDFCDPEDDQCPSGTACCAACCIPDIPPTCTTLDEDGVCPLPDISVDGDELAASVTFTTETFEADSCAVEEACVTGTGERKLMRFTTKTPNTGTAALSLGFPEDRPDLFVWSSCHGHWHLKDFADYSLVDAEGTTIPAGHKQAFCLMDAEPLDGTTGVAAYTCANQGISVGWADTYVSGLDCQWIDVTDVPSGTYTFKITIDPTDYLPDKDPSNDEVSMTVEIP